MVADRCVDSRELVMVYEYKDKGRDDVEILHALRVDSM